MWSRRVITVATTATLALAFLAELAFTQGRAITAKDSSEIRASLELKGGDSTDPSGHLVIYYRRIGESVLKHGTILVTWTTSNAESVTIDALGAVSANGSKQLQPAPRKTTTGTVDETLTLTLTASGPSGTVSRTASVRIIGSIEPVPDVIILPSIFFPTYYPTEGRPDLGLLRSQQRRLLLLAESFLRYYDYDRTAELVLEGHTDTRGSAAENRALAERRAAIVKKFLVHNGIPSRAISIQAFGQEGYLDRSTLQRLEGQNPEQPPPHRRRSRHRNWLAYNRRVDIVLRPLGVRSIPFYPHAAADSAILWGPATELEKEIHQAQNGRFYTIRWYAYCKNDDWAGPLRHSHRWARDEVRDHIKSNPKHNAYVLRK